MKIPTFVQKFALDARARLTRRIKMKGATELTTQYTRDLLGRITSVIDPNLNEWTYDYDYLRRKGVTDPDLGHWTYTLDAASRLTEQTDARGIVTVLTYDELSNVTRKCVSGGTPAIPTEVTANTYHEARDPYSNRGRLTSAWRGLKAAGADCDGDPVVRIERQFDYDLAGRLSAERHLAINGATRSFAYEYYPSGALRRRQMADGAWTGVHRYDAAGRLLEVEVDAALLASAPNGYITQATYTERGQRHARRLGRSIFP